MDTTTIDLTALRTRIAANRAAEVHGDDTYSADSDAWRITNAIERSLDLGNTAHAQGLIERFAY